MLRFCNKFVTKERVCSSCFRNSITTNGQQHKKPVHESFKCQLTVKPFRINQVLQVLQLTENNFACTSQACSNFPKLKFTFSRQCLEIPSELMDTKHKKPVFESFKCQLMVKPFRISQVLQVLQFTENNFGCTRQACENFPK